MTDPRPFAYEVDRAALACNLARVRARVPDGTRVICSVKANAYGHGLLTVARALDTLGVEALATASADEAVAMARAGLRSRVLLFGGHAPEAIAPVAAAGVTPTVANAETARALAAGVPRGTAVYVKVDSGLGRLGVAPADVRALVRDVLRPAGITVAGVYTHLPFADADGERWARAGLERFAAVTAGLHDDGVDPPVVQALSSPGIAAGLPLCGNAVAPGRLLYGLGPAAADTGDWGLEPALRAVRTRLVHVARHPADTAIGSGGRARIRAGEAVGVVPVGRARGYLAVPAPGVSVLHRGRRAPVLGVSLEHTTVRLGSGVAAVGDEVVLLGGGPGGIALPELAAWSGRTALDTLVVLGREAT